MVRFIVRRLLGMVAVTACVLAAVRERYRIESRENERLLSERNALLEAERAKAMEALRAESDLMAYVSHEIRNPLSAAIGIAPRRTPSLLRTSGRSQASAR